MDKKWITQERTRGLYMILETDGNKMELTA
jgi:hypothetical protein